MCKKILEIINDEDVEIYKLEAFDTSIKYNQENFSLVRIQHIKVADIVGSTRYDISGNNWYEFIMNYHKGYLLGKNIVDVLEKPIHSDYPQVIEINGKYYHCGDGKNRIILSKIKKIDTIKVLLCTLKQGGS